MIAVLEEDWGISERDLTPDRPKSIWVGEPVQPEELKEQIEKEKKSMLEQFWDKFWGS